MFDTKELRSFLNKADKPHADGTAEIIRNVDGSNTISYEDGDWSMKDTFYGGEPYGGRQIVHYKGEPVWLCVYYGSIDQRVAEVKEIYDFLRLSLQQAPVNGFSRGPARFAQGDFEYCNQTEGTIESYAGEETIHDRGIEIYRARYLGGFVDRRNQGEY